MIGFLISTVAAAHLATAQGTLFWDIDGAARRARHPNTLPGNRDANNLWITSINATATPTARDARIISSGGTILLTNGSGSAIIDVPAGISKIILWHISATNGLVRRVAPSVSLYAPNRYSGSTLSAAADTAARDNAVPRTIPLNAGAGDAGAAGPIASDNTAMNAGDSSIGRLRNLIGDVSGTGYKRFALNGPRRTTFAETTPAEPAGPIANASVVRDPAGTYPDKLTTTAGGTFTAGGAAAGTLTRAPTAAVLASDSASSGTTIVVGTLAVKSPGGNGNGKGNGNTNGQNTITISSGQTYSGTGTVSAKFVVNAGGTLSPGGTPGSLSTLDETWKGGAKLVVEVSNATAGEGIGWDVLNIAGALDLNTASGKPVTIDLRSLTLGGVPGDVYNFSNTLSYSWRIVSTRDGINLPAGQTLSSAFALNLAGFTSPLNGGIFSLALSSNNHDLMLSYTPALIPEPDTKYMVVLGFILFFARPRKYAPSYRLRKERPVSVPGAGHRPEAAVEFRREMD